MFHVYHDDPQFFEQYTMDKEVKKIRKMEEKGGRLHTNKECEARLSP